MKKALLFILFVFPLLNFSQNERVKILRAEIVADSIQVERVTVTNISAGTFTITNDLGQFSIFANEGDVLMITGVAFETKQVVLKEDDFKEMIFRIHIDIKINQLEEVKIAPYKLTGNLAYDAKHIKVKPAFKVELPKIDWSSIEITGVQPRVENSVLPNSGVSKYNMDLMKVGGMVAKLFKGNSSSKRYEEIKKASLDQFEIEINKRFSDDFFKEKLKIKAEEKINFIAFCYSNEINEKQLLEVNNSLTLIEYMIAKSDDYRKRN